MIRACFISLVVIGLGGAAHGYPLPLGTSLELRQVAEGYAQQHHSQLSRSTLTRIFVGSETPVPHEETAAWLKLLDEAVAKDARFEIESALALRTEVQARYESSATMTMDKVKLRARAGFDAVAGFLAEGQKLKAAEIARETMRRFQDVAVDRKRHPPSVVKFIGRQKKQAHRMAEGKVTVVATMPGTLYADGRKLGPMDGKRTYRLPQGSYRFWVEGGKRTTLMRPVTVGPAAATVTFDSALDGALQVLPHPHLACTQGCEKILGKLAERLGTTTLVGVRAAAQGGELFEIITVNRQGTVAAKVLVNRHGLTVKLDAPKQPELGPLENSVSSSSFNGWWLVPGGVGQFAQDRVAWGIVFASIEAGLLAWNIQSSLAYYNSNETDEAARKQAEISGIALYSTLALGIVEAVVVGILSEDTRE